MPKGVTPRLGLLLPRKCQDAVALLEHRLIFRHDSAAIVLPGQSQPEKKAQTR